LLPGHRNDRRLDPILDSSNAAEREAAITNLLSAEAYWRVDRILERRFRRSGLAAHHLEDVRAEVLLRIVNRLHRLSLDRTLEPMQDFPAYVSVVAFNTFDDFLRRVHPLRAKLKNRVRYLVAHDPRFALWSAGGVLVCGLRQWQGNAPADVEPPSPETARDLRAALEWLFAQTGNAIELDAAVAALGRVALPETEQARSIGEQQTATHDAHAEVERRQSLQQLWSEIAQLPLRQRLALLLGARDASGESVLRLLRAANIASLRAMAETLEMKAEEFAALWRDLPLDDLSIAKLLDTNRQNVINLRRSARERLRRRTRNESKVRPR
jgi:hypothetical protein